MRTWFALATAAAMATAPASYAAERAVEAPIRTMAEAFNKGDVARAKSTHVAAPMILDETTAPFAWSGPTAFENWIAALGKSEADAGRTGGKVEFGRTTRATVMGNYAYVVVPSNYTFQLAGRTMRETGTMTFGLVKQSADWKIQAWTWTSPEALPVKK